MRSTYIEVKSFVDDHNEHQHGWNSINISQYGYASTNSYLSTPGVDQARLDANLQQFKIIIGKQLEAGLARDGT